MQGRMLCVAAAAALIAGSASPRAHHSIAAVYDSSNVVTLDGTIVEFRMVNPHPFLILTRTGDGATDTWKLEMDNRSELTRIGITAETLKPGDRVTVRGSRARDGSNTVYVRRLDRGDGFWYEQVGSTPRTGRQP